MLKSGYSPATIQRNLDVELRAKNRRSMRQILAIVYDKGAQSVPSKVPQRAVPEAPDTLISLRDLLLKNGISARDLSQAIEDSRDVVRAVNRWAGVGSRALLVASESEKLGNKTRSVVVLGAKVLSSLELGSGSMLERGRK